MGRGRSLAEALGSAGWAVAVAAVYLPLAVAARLDGWSLIGGQLLATAVQVLPVLLLRPPLPFGWTATRAAVSAALVVAGALSGALLNPAGPGTHLRGACSALLSGLGEEVVFRGLVADRLGRAGLRTPARVVVNAALFALLHVPVTLIRGQGAAGVVLPFVFGLVFTALREWSGGLLLPTAVHVAVDLSGS